MLHCSTGYLAVCCQPKLFEELITRLLEGLALGQNSQQNFSVNNTKTYIQAIGAIRWTKYLMVAKVNVSV